MLAAADTFRAGAQDQLRVWADRLGAEFVGGTDGGDPAAVAFDAVQAATSRAVDRLFIVRLVASTRRAGSWRS